MTKHRNAGGFSPLPYVQLIRTEVLWGEKSLSKQSWMPFIFRKGGFMKRTKWKKFLPKKHALLSPLLQPFPEPTFVSLLLFTPSIFHSSSYPQENVFCKATYQLCTWHSLDDNVVLASTLHFPLLYKLCCLKITIFSIPLCCDS